MAERLTVYQEVMGSNPIWVVFNRLASRCFHKDMHREDQTSAETKEIVYFSTCTVANAGGRVGAPEVIQP